MRRPARLALVVFMSLVILPAVVYAQASITGLIKDTSGAVLPGVTVEAASPVLIEKVRSGVTDGTGQYRIEDLRPGLYTVTFTLPGFSTLRREGIQLTGTFVATVNADLRVGSLEETVTVTGESPVVDVQSTVRQRALDQAVLDVLPANRGPAFAAGLLPGVTRTSHDVGGIGGDGSAAGNLRARGVTEARIFSGGMPNITGVGTPHHAHNLDAYQEVVVDTGGIGAEHREAGVRINLIPRDGGNTFAGSFLGAFVDDAMQGDNFTDELRRQGLGTPNSVKQLLDLNPGVGGPIKKDKVWFHATMRYSRAWNYVPVFFNKNAGNPNVWTYDPDVDRGPASDENTITNFHGRVTWQATQRNKLAVSYEISDVCDCPRNLNATLAPEAAMGNWVINSPPKRQLYGEWKAPISSRLLLETNAYRHWSTAVRSATNVELPSGAVGLIGVQEQSTNMRYRATSRPVTDNLGTDTFFARAVLSYITGAHAFKAGFLGGWATRENLERSVDAPIEFRLRNGVPNRLTLFARPHRTFAKLDADHGLFVEDRWTVKRLTLTGGLRYDYFNLTFPEHRIGPTEFTPGRNILIPKTDGPKWHDLSPRVGMALNVFGDGKTALKGNVGRYLVGEFLSGTLFSNMAPSNRLVTSTDRSWNDRDGDFVPDCDLVNPAANGECGAFSDANFGSSSPGLAFDPEVLTGWGKRRYNWQFDVGLQRELLPRVSLDIGYWRTWFGNFIATQNRAYGPTDFDLFSITAPLDPRLPDGGGYVIADVADVKPAAFGRSYDGLVTFAKNFGKQTEHWDGFDVTLNARPRAGMLLQGGTTTERRTTDNCEVVKHAAGEPPSRGVAFPVYNPSQLHCRVDGKFLTQLKLLGSFTVPRVDVQLTAMLQSLPGADIAANYVATNAEISSALGRPLAGGASNVTVNLVEPRTMYGDRLNQLDLRIGKILRFGRTRATISLDLYNALNSSAVLALSNAFATWLQPQDILPARFAKVVVQYNF